MRALLVAALAAGAALFLALAPGARAAATAQTQIHASAQQVAGYLFVAGDVSRLSQIPAGTEDLVLEKVLQQLYLEDPALAPTQGVGYIEGLDAALAAGGAAVSPQTLSVMAGNQRTLAILRVLEDSTEPAPVQTALAQVTDHALIESTQLPGINEQTPNPRVETLNPSVESLSTVSYLSFAPAQVLLATTRLAQTDQAFGEARDALWKASSHESVFSNTAALLGENPNLKNPAVEGFTAMISSDGTLTTTVGQLEQLVDGGIAQMGEQDCVAAPGATTCAGGAIHEAEMLSTICPGGASDKSPECVAARERARQEARAELGTIASQRAATSAAAAALGEAGEELQEAEMAEAQAQAEAAEEEAEYLDYQEFEEVEKGVGDSVTLLVTLSVAEIDPVNAVGAVINVLSDGLGAAFGGPEPNTLILEGLQHLSQQIAAFETFTSKAFTLIDTQLGAISEQIATSEQELSKQIAEVQATLVTLSGNVNTLQTSVDHLQSELQNLFEAAATNELRLSINTYIQYNQNHTTPMEPAQFALAAGIFYSDATSAATPTVVSSPEGFGAEGAARLIDGDDPFSLNGNINYFNLFGVCQTDAGQEVSWPAALSGATTCPKTTERRILPNPGYWATAARAYAQLLEEHPEYVTEGLLSQLAGVASEGEALSRALARLSGNDAGTDAAGTGNLMLDAAIAYYRYWGAGSAHAKGKQPSLTQAITAAEQHYLASNDVPGEQVSYSGVEPWGGPSHQPVDFEGLEKMKAFTNVPICASEAEEHLGFKPSELPKEYMLPSVPVDMIEIIPILVANVARIGDGTIAPCWTAEWTDTAAYVGNLTMEIQLHYLGSGELAGLNDQVVVSRQTIFGVHDCSGIEGNQYVEAIFNVVEGWPGSPDPKSGCMNFVPYMELAPTTGSGASDAQLAALETGPQAFEALQRHVYEYITEDGAGLTSGEGPGTESDVREAATRLAGAGALLNGYVSLGLPQALASDDGLRGLVDGQDADAFAMQDPTANPWGLLPTTAVEEQLLELYDRALVEMPAVDARYMVSSDVETRANALARAIRAHVVPTASPLLRSRPSSSRLIAGGIHPDVTVKPSEAVFAEDDPLIDGTLDRLDETHLAVGNAIQNGTLLSVYVSGEGRVSGAGISCPGACSKRFAPGTAVTLTPEPAGGYEFAGWRGACSGTGICSVQSALYDQTVTATFEVASRTGQGGGGGGSGGGGNGGGGATSGDGGANGGGGGTNVGGGGTNVGGGGTNVGGGGTNVGGATTQPGGPTSTGGTGNKKTGGKGAPKCQLRLTSPRVAIAASKHRKTKRGRTSKGAGSLVLRASCDKRVRGVIRGKLVRRVGKREVTAKLGPKRVRLRPGHAKRVVVKLPATAITALARRTTEQVTFTLVATASKRTARVTTRPVALHATAR